MDWSATKLNHSFYNKISNLRTISKRLDIPHDRRSTVNTLKQRLIGYIEAHTIAGLTQQADNVDQKGYVSRIHPRERKRRAGRRREQASIIEKRLHYHSCYIYFYLRSQGIHPNEVQMMCARRPGHKDRYFLAVNSRDGYNSIENVRRALHVDDHNIIKLNLQDYLQNINNEYQQGVSQKKKRGITKRLKKKKVHFLRLKNVKFTTLNPYPGRHAEEFLCDRANALREERKKMLRRAGKPYTFFIYGKRRPCITCKVKMQTARITHFNINHGRLFLNTIINGRLTPAEMHRVINILLRKPSNITSRRDGTITTHYPSDEE